MGKIINMRLVTAGVCGGWLSAMLIAAGHADAQDYGDLLADVKKAWDGREVATKTVRMHWSLKTVTPKGGISLIMPRPFSQDGKIRPASDHTSSGKADLLLMGLHARYSEEGAIWDEPTFQFTSKRTVAAYKDGRTSAVQRVGIQDWPSGTIRKSEWNVSCISLSTWAPCSAVRGTHSGVMGGDHLGAFSTARRFKSDEVEGIELSQPRTERRGEIKMRVLPTEGYCPIGYEVFDLQGELVQRISVGRRAIWSGVWLPKNWTCLSFKAKRLTSQIEATMDRVEIGGEAGESEFAVDFPPGTRVSDMTGESINEYIVKESGGPRQILPEERAAGYDDLLRSEPGELFPQGRKTWLQRNRYNLAIVGCVVVAVAILARWKLVRRSSNSSRQV